jgi:hypothetical protein
MSLLATTKTSTAKAHGCRSVGFLVCAVLGSLVAPGCGSPNVASIAVRKQNQDLQDQVASLTRAREADAATIRALQEKQGGGLPTLPPDRLDKLFTVHGIKLGRLTGGADLDSKTPGDEGLKVYVTPTDDDGEPLKAAGTFVVEAFDLAAKTPELGKWEFDLAATRKAWIGAALVHQFVLTCPWQQRPRHEEVTVKVTFRDELTGREFHEQRVVKIQPPPASAPAAITPTPTAAQSR